MCIVHSNRIELLSLESLFCTHIVTVASGLKPRYATPFKNNLLFTCNGKHNLYLWSLDTKETSTFAGSDSEGSRDGTAKHCQFYEQNGAAVEFDHNIYVCDFRSGAIKLITTLKNTVKFLSSIGKIYNAFSIHEKGHRYELCSITEAI